MHIKIPNYRLKSFDSLFLISLFYFLFIWRSWKVYYAPSIDGIKGTNELYVLAFICFIMTIRNFLSTNKCVFSLNSPGFIYFLLMLFVILRLFLLNPINQQNIYATVVSYLPLLLAVLPQDRNNNTITNTIVFIAVLLSFYSFVGIIVFFASGQLRLSLPLGVATTLVFLFIISIPIIHLAKQKVSSKALGLFLSFGFWMTAVASILTVSRAGIPIAGILIAWCLFDSSNNKEKVRKLFIVIVTFFSISLLITLFIDLNSLPIDFSRLFSGFDDSSTSERKRAALLGLEIFKNNFWLGAGNGTYYTRLYTYTYWTDKMISAYGKLGLLDPHNAFVLLLSENGLIGFLLFVLLIYKIVRRIWLINDNSFRLAGFQMLIGIGLYSFASSDLFSVVGLSSIVWYLVGSFNSYSYNSY